MTGWVSQWPALVLLLVCAAAPASVEDVDLKLISMNWTYEEDANTTFLTVCTEGDLLYGTITLTLSNSKIEVLGGEYNGNLIENNRTCANFDTSGYQPLPAEMTTYELSTEFLQQQQSGSVAFSLERATITCGSSTFLRFNPSAGTLDDVTCISFYEDMSPVCYVEEEEITSDTICFTGVDEANLDFQVCIQKETFIPLDPHGGSFTADELNYDAKRFAFTFADGDLKEVLILSNETGTSPTVVSCEADNNCVDEEFSQSTAYYDLCGVFIDEEGMAVDSSIAHFQDMDLKVDTVEPTVDFHFINKNDDGLYFVSGMNAEYESLLNLSLDCSHITQDTICNGFFSANEDLKNIAVSYADGTNTIITQVP